MFNFRSSYAIWNISRITLEQESMFSKSVDFVFKFESKYLFDALKYLVLFCVCFFFYKWHVSLFLVIDSSAHHTETSVTRLFACDLWTFN